MNIKSPFPILFVIVWAVTVIGLWAKCWAVWGPVMGTLRRQSLEARAVINLRWLILNSNTWAYNSLKESSVTVIHFQVPYFIWLPTSISAFYFPLNDTIKGFHYVCCYWSLLITWTFVYQQVCCYSTLLQWLGFFSTNRGKRKEAVVAQQRGLCLRKSKKDT